MSDRNALFARRQRRTRYALRQASGGRPRLSVFRSGKHIYAQVIDDRKGLTLASASSLDKDVKGKIKTGADKGAAAEVGKLIAQRAVAAALQRWPMPPVRAACRSDRELRHGSFTRRFRPFPTRSRSGP